MIKESKVLERIAQCVDEMDVDDLAKFHNETSNFEPITGDEIILQEGWHLVPKEGAH